MSLRHEGVILDLNQSAMLRQLGITTLHLTNNDELMIHVGCPDHAGPYAPGMYCPSLLHQYIWNWYFYSSFVNVTDNVCHKDTYVQILAGNTERSLS